MSKPVLIIVDDEPDMVEIVQYIAEMIGFDVRTASGAEAFQKIWKKTRPSAIVMDVVMPAMDGHELLQWLVEQGCTAPVLLMSGYNGKYLSSAERLGKVRGASIVGTLSKPFSVGDIEAKLKQILDTVSVWSDDMSVGIDIIDADHRVPRLHHKRSVSSLTKRNHRYGNFT
jgi:CheY-like chemotaxis protein